MTKDNATAFTSKKRARNLVTPRFDLRARNMRTSLLPFRGHRRGGQAKAFARATRFERASRVDLVESAEKDKKVATDLEDIFRRVDEWVFGHKQM